MSGPKPALPKARLAADDEPLIRLAASLEALAGDRWRQLRYGVAVSGGADSMVLLAMMARLLPGHVWAATVDHRLRAASSDEADMVARWCAETDIPHCTLVPHRPITGSVQAAARTVRYALLSDWSRDNNLAFVLTAHHADDQLETMVMRLNRASGVGGLAGIRVRQGEILRPLLGWRRSELESYAARHAVPFVTDPSNADPRFDRARLRRALAGQTLVDVGAAARSARWLDEADEALDWMASQLVAGWPDADDPHVLRDARYPTEVFRRIVSRRLCALQPGLTVRGVALDGVMRAMRAGHRAMVGDLLIDPVPNQTGRLWRISAAPRRKPREK